MNARKIPATMVTQHPDHASKPYWHDKAYLTVYSETEEAYRSFADLGATEYKWDWEGKLVDESVVERLYGEYFDYFSKNKIGLDRFLTFRLPNPRAETEFRLIRAFINMASAGAVAKHFGFSVPPLFEVILPLTETAEEMLALQEAYEEIHLLKHPLFKLDGFLTNLRVVPLFETVSTIINSDKILKKYLAMYEKRFKKRPPYMRPYVARSDPALNSGIIPTVLAIKLALSRYRKLAIEEKLPLHPVIGAGSLPFRGGLNPDTVVDFANEYKGIRTTTIQSAFRYDYSPEQAKKAIHYLETNLVKNDAVIISPAEEKKIMQIIVEGERCYKHAVEEIARMVNKVASFIPKRRERLLHIGLFGYSRGEGKVKLPRAIGFTCALYSIGVPPEFIGTGKTIAFAKANGLLPILEKYYINLLKDIRLAGRYVNKHNLEILSKTSAAWQEILENVQEIEEYLGEAIGPKTKEDKEHQRLTSKILEGLDAKQNISEYITQAAVIRKSLG